MDSDDDMDEIADLMHKASVTADTVAETALETGAVIPQ